MPVSSLIKAEFGRAVTEALGEMNANQASYKTGLSDEYIRKMAKGRVPSEAVLEKFAKGLGVDLQTLRVAAGYERPADPVQRVEFALEGQDHLEDWQIDSIVRLAEQLRKKKD